MGDMADYVNEQIEEEYEARYEYRRGHMSDEEAYDRGIIDENGSEYGTVTIKTCRCCGETGLMWRGYKGKWRLFQGDQLHDCPANPLRD